jgi:hypothetical protein
MHTEARRAISQSLDHINYYCSFRDIGLTPAQAYSMAIRYKVMMETLALNIEFPHEVEFRMFAFFTPYSELLL